MEPNSGYLVYGHVFYREKYARSAMLFSFQIEDGILSATLYLSYLILLLSGRSLVRQFKESSIHLLFAYHLYTYKNVSFLCTIMKGKNE